MPKKISSITIPKFINSLGMTDSVAYGTGTLATNARPEYVPQKIPILKFNRLYGKHDYFEAEYRLSQKASAELLGSMLFVYGVCPCEVFGDNKACSIIGSCFMAGTIIYIFGRISGDHFNPAVSLALFISHKLELIEFLLYVLVQIIGGFIGAILVGLCNNGKFKVLAANEILDNDSSLKRGIWYYVSPFLFEIIGTFILIMFILASCQKDNYLGPTLGYAFSTILIAISGIGGNVSGCSFNPIRSFAPAIFQVIDGDSYTPLEQLWIYIVGPLLGAIIAAFLWPVFVYEIKL